MTNCPECETSLKAGKKFCTACGAALAAPIAKSGPVPVPSPTLKPTQTPAIAPAPASKLAPPPRHWLRIVLSAALLIFAVIVFSVAWTVFTTDGFFDFRDDEILVAWGLTILGLGAGAGAVLILRRGRSRRP